MIVNLLALNGREANLTALRADSEPAWVWRMLILAALGFLSLMLFVPLAAA